MHAQGYEVRNLDDVIIVHLLAEKFHQPPHTVEEWPEEVFLRTVELTSIYQRYKPAEDGANSLVSDEDQFVSF